MTPQEARKVKVGTAVTWMPTGEAGKVTEKGEAGIRVIWADGTDAVYLWNAGAFGARGLSFVEVQRLTPAQRRLLDLIRMEGGADDFGAEYWPVVNDWVRDKGPTASLALRNINRTVAALERDGYVTIDNQGCFRLTEKAR